MYNADKIIIGLIIFLLLLSFPIWYSMARGQAAEAPELEIVTDAEECIEPVEFMRAEHMELLNEWKHSVVREANRIYVASDGKEYEMSLTGTCLDCHSNKEEFCDSCHEYAAVEPECWDCHVIPGETEHED